MISEIVDPPERLREEAQELAEKIAKNSPAAMAATKRALWGALELGLTDACRAGAAELVSMWGHPDQTEGPLAFAEKREPDWAELEPSTDAGGPAREPRRPPLRRDDAGSADDRPACTSASGRGPRGRGARPGRRDSPTVLAAAGVEPGAAVGVMLPERRRRGRRAVRGVAGRRRVRARSTRASPTTRSPTSSTRSSPSSSSPRADRSSSGSAAGRSWSSATTGHRLRQRHRRERAPPRPRRRPHPVHLGHDRPPQAGAAAALGRARPCSTACSPSCGADAGEAADRRRRPKPADAEPHPGVAVAVGRASTTCCSPCGSARRSS